MNKTIKTDICVIGAGSGGLSVAAGAAQMGARVVLVEGGKMGGDCLNTGCVPSKSLIAAAAQAHAMTSGAPFGIAPVDPVVDYPAVVDHVAGVIAGIAPHDSVERFTGLGVEVIESMGKFISNTELAAGDTIIRARRFVIATGSVAMVPPIPGLETVPFDTNETIFTRSRQPEHLLVIGGGPIGMELSQAHRRLGSRVTVIEGLTALHREDPEIAAIALDNIRAEGVQLFENELVSEIRGESGAIEVLTRNGDIHQGTDLLIAVGRRPATENLGLAEAGVRSEVQGIAVNDAMKTTNPRIYAIGDVTGGMQFTHAAGYQAGIVIRSALFGLRSRAATAHIPRATFTDPEIAQVGLTEAQARQAHGANLEVARFAFAGSDRARAERRTDGMIKVMVMKGRPVGVSIVGRQAGELIALWSLAISNRLKMKSIASMVAPYPTMAEVNNRVAGAYFGPRLFENRWIKRAVRLVQRF